MRKTSVLASLALLVAVGTAGAETLKIGTSADFAPWESVDTSGQIVGFDKDLGTEICKRIGADCRWANQAFDGLLPGLQVGKFDLIISGVSINEEREKKVDFSIAYADAPNDIAVANGSDIASAKTRADLEKMLQGKTIGVQTGSTHEQVVRAHFANADVRLYDRPEQIADDLSSGRIDAGLMERSAWEGLTSARGDNSLVFAGPLLTSADYVEFGRGQGVALRKGEAPLKGRIDNAIAAMLKDGTVANLSQQWFKYDVSSKRK
jgi:octopine/nopaline transport system substrate-binding protein